MSLPHSLASTIHAKTCVECCICGVIRPMAKSFHTTKCLLKDVGAETLAEYERRAGISVQTLLDMIRNDRVRYPDSDSCLLAHSLVCNDPKIKAVGELELHEESKAYKMLVILAEYRDGPNEARFSLRHAYNTAFVHRDTLIGWRKDHPLFDRLVESIQEEMVDSMRAEAYRRAVIGHDEPVFYQGARVDTVKKFSDQLLQFTLMGHDARYRAKDVNMNVSGSLTSNVNIEGLRDRLAQRLQQKAKAEE